jgi:iron complex outermembrane receptor protein
VFWESLDVFLPDVERIEVIRGPGGALWGRQRRERRHQRHHEDVVRHTRDVRTTGVGTENRGFAGARYGGKVRWGNYRVYGQFRAEDDRELCRRRLGAATTCSLVSRAFAWSRRRKARCGGFCRATCIPPDRGWPNRDDVKMSGANVLSRFTRAFSPSSRLQMQLYYDRTNRRVPNQYQGTRDTFDFDLQQQFSVGRPAEFSSPAAARACLTATTSATAPDSSSSRV